MLARMVAYLVGLGLAVGLAVFVVARRARAVRAEADRQAIAREVAAIRATAEAEAGALRRRLELDARSRLQDERRRLDEEAQRTALEVENRVIAAERTGQELLTRDEVLGGRVATLVEREEALSAAEAEAQALRDEAHRLGCDCDGNLQRIAGETPADLKQRLVSDWIEQARAAAAERLRRVEGSVTDAEHARSA